MVSIKSNVVRNEDCGCITVPKIYKHPHNNEYTFVKWLIVQPCNDRYVAGDFVSGHSAIAARAAYKDAQGEEHPANEGLPYRREALGFPTHESHGYLERNGYIK